MYNKKTIILFVLTILISNQSFSAVYWVGNSGLCQGTNVRNTLNEAILAAAFTSENDEIRLTATVSYQGNTNGNATLDGFHPGVRGSLTIRGGYNDCFSATTNNRTLMGNTNDTVITVKASAQPSSIVTLINLNLVGGAFRGITAVDNVTVTLDNVRIADNPSGMYVDGGAYVNILANSIIEDNTTTGFVGNGGGFECKGDNSQVDVHGIIKKNMAQKGANFHVSSGCYVELYGGSRIEGGAIIAYDAVDGGGAYVAAGGVLYSNGGANRVGFIDNGAQYGGAIYIADSGRATLLNTNIINSHATFGEGGAIYAVNGGTSSPQLVMDRVGACPFSFSCSEIQDATYDLSLIFATNSWLQFNRTLIERNTSTRTGVDIAYSIAKSVNSGIIQFNRVGIINNETNYINIAQSSGKVDMAHTTIAGNYFDLNGNTEKPWVTMNTGIVNIQNSIFSNTQGTDWRGGSRSSFCNLVDDPGDMPSGYYIGTALFNNVATGDARQQSLSPGVDMCNQDSFSWTASNKDIEYQDSPVNDSLNQQGIPGDSGGLFDAGFDEVYSNIGEDNFLLTVMKTGSGSVISLPLGIACGSDCNEVYFNGTNVELLISASPGSAFSGWSGCDRFPIDGNSCFVFMDQIRNVTITFTSNDDLIFKDGFE